MNGHPVDPGLTDMARVAEEVGADALHLSDHVVLPEQYSSRYPFTPDGQFPWPSDSDWYDTFVSCAWVASATSTVDVGPSVLVLPQRRPLEVAKAASSLSQLSQGRFFLGVGAGWLAEEFTALGANFSHRTAAMLEAIDILRTCWSGTGAGYAGEHFAVPEGTHCRPLPAEAGVPILMGGMSGAARRRAATHADGWVALMGARDDAGALAAKLDQLQSLRKEHGHQGNFRTVVRVVNHAGSPSQTASRLQELADIGFDEVVVDPGWNDLAASGRMLAECRSALDHA